MKAYMEKHLDGSGGGPEDRSERRGRNSPRLSKLLLLSGAEHGEDAEGTEVWTVRRMRNWYREGSLRSRRETGTVLDDMQRRAVTEAAGRGLFILTGGPGTGKTTTINAIIRFFEGEGAQLRLAAPTGRAAKRMTEATGYEAQTIHRLLELSGMPEDGGDERALRFERNFRESPGSGCDHY